MKYMKVVFIYDWHFNIRSFQSLKIFLCYKSSSSYERINIFHRKGARFEINNEGEIHIVAGPHQDINIQAANVNIHDKGSGGFNVFAKAGVKIVAEAAAEITATAAAKIVSSIL